MLKNILCLVLNLVIINCVASDETRPSCGREDIFDAIGWVLDSPRTVARALYPFQLKVNEKLESDATPLHLAAGQLKVEVVRWLLANKADANVSGGFSHRTPLEQAIVDRENIHRYIDRTLGRAYYEKSYGKEYYEARRVETMRDKSSFNWEKEKLRKLDIIIAELTKR